MLKRIPKILSPDLVKILMEMGHGDEILLADANYPSASSAQKLVRADGHVLPEILDAILELFPLDLMGDIPVTLMEITTDDKPIVWKEYFKLLEKHGYDFCCKYKSKDEFYCSGKQSYAIVATGETSLYANIILRKGVV